MYHITALEAGSIGLGCAQGSRSRKVCRLQPNAPLCDTPSGCCSFTRPWTVTRSSLRMLRRVAAFCRPLRPVLLRVSFPRSRSPVVGVLGLCWMWRDVPFACQRRPIIITPPPPPRTHTQQRGGACPDVTALQLMSGLALQDSFVAQKKAKGRSVQGSSSQDQTPGTQKAPPRWGGGGGALHYTMVALKTAAVPI